MGQKRQERQIVAPAWLLAAGVSYFIALMLAREGIQLLILALLAFLGTVLLRQPVRQVAKNLSGMWLMLALAGVIHFAFRWWLAPNGSLYSDGLTWLNESLFFTSRLSLFLVCGIVLGLACSAERYIAALAGSIRRAFGLKSGSQTVILLMCAWTIVPSVRRHYDVRSLARRARRVGLSSGLVSRLREHRAEFFSMLTCAIRHADALSLSIWTRQVDITPVEAGENPSRAVPAIACGVFCILCLSILPL